MTNLTELTKCHFCHSKRVQPLEVSREWLEIRIALCCMDCGRVTILSKNDRKYNDK